MGYVEQKALRVRDYFLESRFKRYDIILVTNGNFGKIGTIYAKHPANGNGTGRLELAVYDIQSDTPWQYGSASGNNQLQYALTDLTVGTVRFTRDNDWKFQLREADYSIIEE